MPGKFLTQSERDRLNSFPKDITNQDLINFFTLSLSDIAQLPVKSAEYNRLGFAVQLCTLRYLGFCPDAITTIPIAVIAFVANQLGIDPEVLIEYAKRDHTRTDHLQQIQIYLRFRKCNTKDLEDISSWLTERALEHDKPTLLFQMACERLYSDKIVRPGITTLERMVISARQQAQIETYQKLESLLTHDRILLLDSILKMDEEKGRTPFIWLRFGATSNTPSDILKTIEKLDFLRRYQIDQWDLSTINPNRKRFLAQIGRRSTSQDLQRSVLERRYPILVSFLYQTYEEIIDEVVELFDRCLADCYSRAKGDLKEFRLSIAKKTNEKLRILREVGRILLDQSISDLELRSIIYQLIPEDEFRTAIGECNSLIRPKDDKSYDYFGNRYSYIREFAPKFLEVLKFKSNQDDDSLLKALGILRDLNAKRKRKVPENAPIDFIPNSWIPYVRDDQGKIVRRYYEISTLWELRGALRSGDIWIENSRRYADPESYLIPKELWPSMKSEACRLLGLPESGEERIKQRHQELKEILAELDQNIDSNDGVRIEDKTLPKSASLQNSSMIDLTKRAKMKTMRHFHPRPKVTARLD